MCNNWSHYGPVSNQQPNKLIDLQLLPALFGDAGATNYFTEDQWCVAWPWHRPSLSFWTLCGCRDSYDRHGLTFCKLRPSGATWASTTSALWEMEHLSLTAVFKGLHCSGWYKIIYYMIIKLYIRNLESLDNLAVLWATTPSLTRLWQLYPLTPWLSSENARGHAGAAMHSQAEEKFPALSLTLPHG